ncbi:SDR family oxidoreductase [Maribellus maritimus]|uniref:SDR family oxidoreductase n=1 Tax=Maribellus maritimus TaxID=2870838 RepID=UPI001EEAA3BF|nr:SDR family oxidoreductase [Maribellus maritimus]MCG6188998.1 SDR family oxidoreductase [Maribellus maritimus]
MKTVLITGGSAGIGLATAKAFINNGAIVFITGRNPDNLKKAEAEINSPNLKTIVSDITDLTSISALAQTIADKEEKLDVLFLNAGIGTFASIETTSEENFDEQFNTNVKGMFFTLQKLIPHLAEGSAVILSSSGASVSAAPNTSVYSATKSAVDAIGRVAASELAIRKIRVNVIAPGPTITQGFNNSVPAEAVKGLQKQTAASIPLKRLGLAEEIADTVIFLASNANITGAYLSVDGGFTLRSKV